MERRFDGHVSRRKSYVAWPSIPNPRMSMDFLFRSLTVMDPNCPSFWTSYSSMSTRDLPQQTPLMFDTLPPLARSPEPPRELKDEKGTDRLAKDFVRWCCSFGAEFRNSPDITNLRYWAQKNKLKIKDREESDILNAARAAYLKKVEQSVRKAEPKTEAPN